ncbi:chorismate--pyruvate lyase family protein [Ketobacter sp.]|uniref:chorismate--pyruvate lyase family protein n=1 Tax=Ketobacter sp. TaxID=2083498 RepID=UPI000F1338F9|nr:chorismate lyase [Ketobacter sp.]RLT95067.1 MAG: chorismate lyase [Ketobacter sp.]
MANQHFLPAILQDQALYLGGGGRTPPYQVPRRLRPWLLDRGSLTQRLIRASGGEFRVRLLRQGHQQATDQEREALGLEQRSWPFLREVALLCHEQPWVFARTLIPTDTLQGPAKALTRLGTKPLGAVLFNHPHVRRGPISVYRLDAGRVSRELAGQGILWGRQSLFFLYDKPLLVSEYFLHACPMYL